MEPQAKQAAIQKLTQAMAQKAQQAQGGQKAGPDPQIEQMKIQSQEKMAMLKMQLEQQKEQAAQQLGWPAGSISRRLERARALLRRRLVHRGVLLAIGLIGVTCEVCSTKRTFDPADYGA